MSGTSYLNLGHMLSEQTGQGLHVRPLVGKEEEKGEEEGEADKSEKLTRLMKKGSDVALCQSVDV